MKIIVGITRRGYHDDRSRRQPNGFRGTMRRSTRVVRHAEKGGPCTQQTTKKRLENVIEHVSETF